MDQGTIPMTLREQCEALLRKLGFGGGAEDYPEDYADIEVFAKQQQAVGLREAAEAYRRWLPSTIPKAGDWRPPLRFDEWCEQQAREREEA